MTKKPNQGLTVARANRARRSGQIRDTILAVLRNDTDVASFREIFEATHAGWDWSPTEARHVTESIVRDLLADLRAAGQVLVTTDPRWVNKNFPRLLYSATASA